MDIRKLLRERKQCDNERRYLLSIGAEPDTKHMKELAQRIDYCDRLIFDVPDGMMRNVLVCRYIKGMSIDECADELHYSDRQIRRYIKHAVEYLQNRA